MKSVMEVAIFNEMKSLMEFTTEMASVMKWQLRWNFEFK